MDVERTIEFILEQQARTEGNLERVSEDLRRIDARLDRAVRLAVQEARIERRERREMDARWEESKRALAESLERLSNRVDAFLAGRRNGGNGKAPELPQ